MIALVIFQKEFGILIVFNIFRTTKNIEVYINFLERVSVNVFNLVAVIS